MNSFVLIVSGWRKLISQMPAWGKAVFFAACVVMVIVGMVIGRQPSTTRVRGVKTKCEEMSIVYYTSGKICAPYREAFMVGKNLVLESPLSDQCYCFDLPPQTLWVYVPSSK